MYNLKIWKGINKKINSTYRVSSTPDYDIEVVLKEDTSLETPTFLLDLDDWEINYCYFQGHYYFIDDIRRNITGQLEIECTQDVLATYKDAIGNYTAFVERSSYSYDTMISDPALSSRNGIHHANSEVMDLTLAANDGISTTGCYLLRAVSAIDNTSTTTGITTYVLDESDLKAVLDFMFTDSNFPDIFTDMMVKSFFNPFQYIVDLRWVPYTKTKMTSGSSVTAPVKFGWFSTGYSAPILTKNVLSKTFTIATPSCLYPNTDFRRWDSNYTQFRLYVFGVGSIDLSPTDVLNSVYIYRTIDFPSGKMITRVCRSDPKETPLAEFTTDFTIPVNIAQVNSNLFDSAMNTVKTAGSAMQATAFARTAAGAELAAAGGVLKVGESIISAIRSEVSAGIQGNGSFGCRAALLGFPYYILYEAAYDSAEFPVSVAGRPLYKNVRISTIPGFIKCSGASVNIAGFAGDKEAVNSALNGGFYYE